MNKLHQLGIQLMPVVFVLSSVFLYYIGAKVFAGFYCFLGIATYAVLFSDEKSKKP